MSPTTTMILISSLATGTIITLSSYHWLLAWIGLEINTLAIIPIISKQHHPRSTEAATKYFLTQAAASALILFSSTINAWEMGTWNILSMTNSQANVLLTMALAMKLGLAPAHFWLPEVLQGSTMKTALIISTWQKLAPTALMFLTINNLSPKILLTMGLLSTTIGGWGGLNQTQLRKIMAYSSIAHLGWIVTIAPMMTNIMILNLMIYITMTTSMFLALITTQSKTIQDTTTSWTSSPTITITTMLTLLSLGGLPPLSGFLPKWLILEELTTQNLTPMATLLAMTSLLSLFFYLRLTYTTTLTLSPNTPPIKHKWRFKPKTSKLLTITLPTSTMILPLTPMMLL
uniref:NADH-ubiquinone oxidoreductase chain 2 n=5 Tax=Crotaphytus collaris TaxID=43591 RepID=A9QFY1_CROCO|nr:NADH dehydrogenase subunit 2 [Crotaphytus collaris]ABW04361.1 NADH dehydrogenase subunit 2 [Crotaphytus collaris]ABW04362.1 NADH dehydrogenase subunit 2 [Crotaphytus collaris]ABW04363.1 NADH dehydrogenase subunit 2 [Crotaphytus collaris]ABW04364.1 NADH dehydrogenase subunit 2 [Crotaphytus collaris]